MRPDSTAPVVEVKGLVRKYGDLVAASDVSFTVNKGEMFGLIGPDGAGKTTTLRVILGLLRPHGGEVRTCSLDPWNEKDELSKRIGYLSQKFSLYGDLTVDENVAFFADIHGVRNSKARGEELLEMLRMTPFRTRLADRLSGGMKQKLALACTLIHTPQLLVLDEPTTGVDPVSRRDFWKILAGLQRDGLTLLVTTPYLDEAERCQRVALMDRSRILNVSTPDEVRAHADGAMVEILAHPKRQAMEIIRANAEVRDVEAFGERVHVTLPNLDASLAAAWTGQMANELRGHGVEVLSARPIPHSLEDVFIARIQAIDAAAAQTGGAH
ncbi:MAG: ABC transporter ATP-binding protein [Vicinamibacteria bacterium]